MDYTIYVNNAYLNLQKVPWGRVYIPYMRKFSPGENFCQFCQCMLLAKIFPWIFLHSENFDTFASVHAYAHSNSWALPTTSWKVTRTIDEIKLILAKILSQYIVWVFGKNVSQQNLVIYGTFNRSVHRCNSVQATGFFPTLKVWSQKPPETASAIEKKNFLGKHAPRSP